MNKMTIKAATATVGGLSAPSKMPTFGISLPASECKVGQKLRKVKGSVCEKCYACKGMYVFANVKNALATRLAALDDPNWVPSMVFLLKNKKQIVESGLFRWHDSGDIQSVAHLAMIAEVARQTPEITHWIPTKEKGIVAKFKRMHTVPANLIIRVSGAMIDGDAPKGAEFTSTVVSDKSRATCRAFLTEKVGKGYRMLSVSEYDALPPKHGRDLGHCGECRKCWDKTVKSVSYHQH